MSVRIIVFLLKEGAEARVDVLSSPRVTNSTRVHSRHHLLNRPVRECLVLSLVLSPIHNCVLSTVYTACTFLFMGYKMASCGLANVIHRQKL